MSRTPIVIVADDEPTVRLVAQCALERAGLDVLCAENGREALEHFDANADDICAAVLDVSMPVLNGVDACRELKRHKPDMPVILTSGYDEDEATLEVTADPSVRFMEKPFDLNDLVEIIILMVNP
jgi:CheY-like chemotaxis protein